ncbi:hypothetical protein [Brevibacterium album]|uniref:hypothetical protein n=1 Tax=Brevibacterium album TaxID=417948 RepID=UPI00048BB97D|nr:hypothetical protein [Brevibacterium album]
MTENTVRFTGHLARAARALVQTSATYTADAAGLTRGQLRDFEKGRGSLDPVQVKALRTALERLGAVFLPDGEDGRGSGVRLKFSESKTGLVENWEGEGGFAADDDV